MFQSAAYEKALSVRRETTSPDAAGDLGSRGRASFPEPLDPGFRLRRPRESGMLRLLLLAAAVVGLAGVLGSVTVSAETRKAPQPVAQAAPDDAPQPRRTVRVIQIYNLPAR